MMMNKVQLRAYLRQSQGDRESRDQQSACICRHILNSEFYRDARVIGGYIPILREADITAVMLDALSKGKMLALPLCEQAGNITFRRVEALEDLVRGLYGIMEPKSEAEMVPADEIDLLLVPLEGIDREGFRLGKGGGYYDRFLAGSAVMTVGCALSWQWVERIPCDIWDRPLCACTDWTGIHYFNR